VKDIEKLKHMYTETFNSEAGQKVLRDLEARSNWRALSYVAGDPNATAFEEGKTCRSSSHPQHDDTGVTMSEEAIEQVAQPDAAPMETPAEVAQGGSGNDFLQMVPEELREHPSLSPIKDVENLARSYVNAQRLIGADKIPIPVNPTDEDLDNIYNRLGRPETVDGYEIAVDGNIVTEDVAKSYADIAHKLRLTPDQASGIMDYYRSMASQASEVTAEAETQQRSQTEMALRKEWGDDFDARIEDAGKIAQQFGGGELLEMKLADGTKSREPS